MLRGSYAVCRRWLATRAVPRREEVVGGCEGRMRAVVHLCRQGKLQEVLGMLEWFPDNGFRTPTKIFGDVLVLCRKTKSVEGLQAVLRLAEKEGAFQNSPSMQNAIVSAMVATGQIEQAKSCYQRMEEDGVKLRKSTLSALLESAVALREPSFVALILRSFARHKGFPNDEQLMHQALEVCVPSEHVEDVVGVYKAVEREVDREFATAFCQWIKKHSPGMQIKESQVDATGACTGCGHPLERNCLTNSEHRELLEFVEQMLGKEANTFANNWQSLRERRRLKQLVASQGPFRAVMDGLNISRAQKKRRFCAEQLLGIARHVVALTGPPVLVIAREHLAYQISADTVATCKEEDIHFFFTHNWCSDDYYFVYCSLASGKHSYFISDDRLGDLVNELPPHRMELFERWQRSCRVPVRRYTEKTWINFPFQLPSKVLRVAQCSPGGSHTHLPLQDSNHRTWLCVASPPLPPPAVVT